MSGEDLQRQTSINIQEKANLIWAIADKLVGLYKPHEYGKVILPMCVIKRFEDTLAPTKEGLLAHFTQIYHLYNLLIYNILRRNLQLFITEFCIFSPCIIFISNKNSDKSIEILHISPKYITSVDNLMIHIFSSTFNFLYSFTPSDRLESKS